VRQLKKLSLLLSRVYKLVLLILQILIAIIRLREPSYFLKLTRHVSESLEMFASSMLNSLHGPTYSNDERFLERNKYWKLAHESYERGEWEFGNGWLSKADLTEDLAARENNLDAYNIRIISSNITESIGHTFAGLSMRASMMELNEAPVRQYWLISSDRKTESHLEYWKDFFTVLKVTEPQRISLEQSLWPLLESISTVRCKEGSIQHRFVHNKYAKLREEMKLEPLIKVSEEHKVLGYEYLRKFGIREGDWFVVLHVREGGDLLYGRNAQIKDYAKAIQFINSLGGHVFRIGDSTMTPMEENLGFIDFALRKKPYSWFDIFLIGECRFYIGTTSGPQFIAYSFGKQMIWTNAPDVAKSLYFPNSIILPKLVLNQDNRILTLKEMLDSPAGWTDARIDWISDESGSKKLMTWKDNDPDDIVSAVREILLTKLSHETTELQEKWHREIQRVNSMPTTKISQTYVEKWKHELFNDTD
jgi:putative glycosyltransferase (TIGR04372 family)